MGKTKRKQKSIYEGIQKPTAPPSKRFKTRKDELDRNKKHKGKDDEINNDTN